MSGVSVVWNMLSSSAGLVAVVPATRIKAGILPQRTELPAIAVTSVSAQQHNNLAMASAQYLVTERVQVTVLGKQPKTGGSGYKQVKEILALVRAALPLSRGVTGGITVDAVIPDLEGPDFYDEEFEIVQQSHDFLVTYHR